MASLSRKCPFIASILAVLLAIGGCAHRMPVPSEADRVAMRSVGIACGSYVPESKFNVPAKGRGQGALVGGATGFVAPLSGGSAGGSPEAMMMIAAIGLALAPVGAVIGAGSAMPMEEAKISESALRKALADMKIQESLCGRLIAEAREKASPRSFAAVDSGPSAPLDNVAYGQTANGGIDSVLEAQVTHVGLSTMTWGSDPPMALFLDVKLRLVRVGGDADLWNRSVKHRSPIRRFSEWAKDDGRLIKVEFDRAYGEIAERAIEEVFFLVPLP